MYPGTYLRCAEAEITFSNARICAMYANYNNPGSQVVEVFNASTAVAVFEVGCCRMKNVEEIAGNIALISNQGNCTFEVMARNAQAAGAVAVIMDSYFYGDFSAVAIPAMSVAYYAGAKLRENSGRACVIRIGTHAFH
jgi:hypothetical protein